MVGRSLGHYEILEPLGAGGMGEVYRARDTTLKRQVALKVLPQEMTSSRERLERFQREAEALAALDHPNIVTIHSVEEAGGVHFLTMQLVEGRQLSELIPEGGMPLARIFDIAIPLADALTTAHDQGVIHRDLKPSNIMVTAEGRVKVLDFGLAKLRQEVAPEEATELLTEPAADPLAGPLTQEGRILGTMPYMSPEQLKGKDLDSRTDIFSLGVILYEMATGERPFRGDTSVSLISSIVKDNPRPVDEVKEDLPHHMGRIIRRCLEKDCEQRFQSAKEIRNELEDLKTETISGTSEERLETIAPRQRAPRKATWVAGLAALAILVAIAGLYLYRGWENTQGPGETAGPVIESIGVLPFENLTGDPENELFADGMTDELITEFCQISALRKVTSRSSMMAYKDERPSLPEIGAKLDVEGLLESTVLEVAEQVRINVRLYHAATDTQLWSSSIEQDARNIRSLYSDVVRLIVEEIGLEVTTEEESLLSGADPVDPEAHKAYLMGNFHYNKASVEGWRQAFEYYEQAIEIDPQFAPAHAAMALALVGQPVYGAGAPEEVYPRARDAAQTAISLDDTLATAHMSLGLVKFFYDWDWAAADWEFRRAIQLEPGSADAHYWYGFYLVNMGMTEIGIAKIGHALELNPLSLMTSTYMGMMLYFARRYDEAIEHLRTVLDMDSNFGEAYRWLAISYAKKGQHEDALAALQRLEDLEGRTSSYGFVSGYVHSLVDTKDEFQDRIATSELPPEWQEDTPWAAAVFLGALGEKDEAFPLLERAFEVRSPLMAVAKVDPRLDSLRSDPRFQDLLRRMNFPEN